MFSNNSEASQKNKPLHVDVLISGMGPGGLATALEAAKAGKSVALIEKRQAHYTRHQRVYIGMSERLYLTKMLLGETLDNRNKLPDEKGYLLLSALSKKCRKELFRALRTMTEDDFAKLKMSSDLITQLMDKTGIPADKRDALQVMLQRNPQKIIRNYQDMKLINDAFNPFNPEVAVAQITIKHIERYLKNRVEDANEASLAKNNKNIITIMTHAQLSDIQKNKTCIAASVASTDPSQQLSNTEITCNVLIGADGSRHHAANLVNQLLKEDEKIKYRPITKNESKKDDHISLHCELRSKDGISILNDYAILNIIPPQNSPKQQACLCFIALDKHSLSASGNKALKLVFTSEITAALKSAADAKAPQESIKEFVRSSLINCPVIKCSRDQLELAILPDQKKPGSFRLMAFETKELMRADKACIKLGPEQYFFLIGDAYNQPDYQRSHGMGDALNQAQFLGRIFSKKIPPDQYHRLCQMRHSDLSNYYEMIKEGSATFTTTLTQHTDLALQGIRSTKRK